MLSENNNKKLPKQKAKEKRETCLGSGVPQNRLKTSSIMVRGIFLRKKHNWTLKNSYWLALTNNRTSEKQNKAKEKKTKQKNKTKKQIINKDTFNSNNKRKTRK